MFKSPVVCAPMNGVSDLKLALACAQAGVVPSLIPYAFTDSEFADAVKQIKAVTTELQVAYTFADIVKYHDLILDLGITHIEILEFEDHDITEENIAVVNDLRAQGVKILLKILLPSIIPQFISFIDAVTIKGSDGAGRSARDVDLLKEIPKLRQQYPDLKIVASGGISNGDDIRQLMKAGACAVSIGTLFAMSVESRVPHGVKLKLLNSTGRDIRRLSTGARQRAVVFGEVADDDFNNTHGLMRGLSTGSEGHVFVGNAIESINGILTVSEIVDHLVK
jgi:NAD(P)H-dependent flavin oxidoreductase YrpB (nitropropane dioxygenase family)